MDDLNKRLMNAFQFQAADLRANRGGRISQRQTAVLRAAGTGMRLGMAVFAVVMVGSVGIVAFSTMQSSGAIPGSSDGLVTLGIAGAVAVVVIVIGYLLSRGYMSAARSRQISVAKGSARVLSEELNNFRIAIGSTKLRLLTEEQLAAFQPGTEYRVYYLAGPVPTILSAELAGAPPLDAGIPGEEEDPALQSTQMQTIRRGYLIVIMIGVLALGLPIAGIAASSLPAGLRGLVWLVMIVLAIGFVPLALWMLSPRGRNKE